MTKIKLCSLAVLFGLSLPVFADSLRKESLHVDFNKMIDENNHEKTKLQDQSSNQEAKKKHKRKTIDFKDVEVGWGDDSAPLVDRRFDSVGAPRIVDLNTMTTTSGS